MRLAHLSDPHLGPSLPARLRDLTSKRILGWLSWTVRRRRRHLSRVLDTVISDLRSWAPDHTACTGDLVNISLPAEYVRAAAWLGSLGKPDQLSLVPGNHDAYIDRVWQPGWRHWAPFMSGDDGLAGFPYVRRRGAVALIGLSTAVPSPPGFATGRLGKDQLERLAEILEHLRREDRTRIVLLHHPPLALVDARKALTDREAFVRVLARHGAELVLAGHIHRFMTAAIDGPDHPVPVVVAPSASLLEDGDRRGGYVRLEIDGAGTRPVIRLTLREFDRETGQLRTAVAGRLVDGRIEPQETTVDAPAACRPVEPAP